MKLIATLAALFVTLSAAAASARTVSIPRSDDPTDFALTLYRKVAALAPGKNALVSPYSAREALGLAYIGARGAAADGLGEALRAESPESFMKEAGKIRSEIMGADPTTTFEVANSIWLRSDWRFLDSYAARAKEGFDADVFRCDFTPAAVARADAWVAARTHGKITKAVESLNPKEVALLLNAVYFKGVWKRPFDKTKTREKDFHLASGKVVRRRRMGFSPVKRGSGESGSFDYAEDAGMQAVRLPYGSGRLAMIVLLPSKASALKSVTDKLTATFWRNLRERMAPRPGEVEMPPFKFKTSMNLNGPLIEMGARAAFDKYLSDFRGMAEARRPGDMLYISDVRQEAMIEVDEAGTVAAARTSGIMGARGSAMTNEPPPFVFIADRPFLFAIEDSVTGTLLFVGSVQDPR